MRAGWRAVGLTDGRAQGFALRCVLPGERLELFLQYFPDQFVRRLILLFTANPLGKNAINTTRTHTRQTPSKLLGRQFQRHPNTYTLDGSALSLCKRVETLLSPVAVAVAAVKATSNAAQTHTHTHTHKFALAICARVCLCFEYYTQQRLAMPSMMLRRRGCCCGATSQSKAAQRSAAVPRLCSPCLTRSMRGLDARTRAQYTFALNMYIVNAHSEWRWWWQIGMRAGRGMVYVRKAHKFKRGNSRRKRFCNQRGGESREIHTHTHTL